MQDNNFVCILHWTVVGRPERDSQLNEAGRQHDYCKRIDFTQFEDARFRRFTGRRSVG